MYEKRSQRGKNGEKNGENSGTVMSLPVDQLQRLCQKQAQYLCRVAYAYVYSTSKSERMLMKKLLIISAVFNGHTYNMFSLSEEHQFGPFLYFWPQLLHYKRSIRDFLLCLLYFLGFTKSL